MTYLLIAIVALYYVLLVRSHVRPYLLLRVKSNHMKYLPMAALLVTLPLTALASPPPAQAQIRLGIELPVPVEPYYFSPGSCEACRHGTWGGEVAKRPRRPVRDVTRRPAWAAFSVLPSHTRAIRRTASGRIATESSWK